MEDVEQVGVKAHRSWSTNVPASHNELLTAGGSAALDLVSQTRQKGFCGILDLVAKRVPSHDPPAPFTVGIRVVTCTRGSLGGYLDGGRQSRSDGGSDRRMGDSCSRSSGPSVLRRSGGGGRGSGGGIKGCNFSTCRGVGGSVAFTEAVVHPIRADAALPSAARGCGCRAGCVKASCL